MHPLEKSIHSKLEAAGHKPPHGEATEAMMATIKNTIKNHKAGTKVNDYHMGYPGDVQAKDDVRHVADKAHDAVSGIHGAHTDPHDVMSSELIRHTLKHHRDGGK